MRTLSSSAPPRRQYPLFFLHVRWPVWPGTVSPLLDRLSVQRRGLKVLRDDGTGEKRRPPVISFFEHLPPDYNDADGLVFGRHDLTLAEVHAIFGSHMGCKEGNTLLRVLHGRRVAGTLNEPAIARSAVLSHFSPRDTTKALEHLRRLLPVNELVNAGLRAQKELDSISRQSYQEEVDAGRAEPIPEPDPRYGESQFDVLRFRLQLRSERRRRLREEEAAKKAAAEAASAKSGSPANTDSTTVFGITIPRREPSEFVKKWTALATSTLTEPPEMSRWERLGPAVGVTLAVLGVLIVLLVVYHPSQEPSWLLPDVSPAAITVGGIALLNVAVWFAWKIPPMWWFLNSFFMLESGMPRAASVLLAGYSHQSAGHLMRNLAVFLYIAPLLHDDIGRSAFLSVYIGSGVVGLMGSLTYMVMRGVLTATSLGMSGSVLGVAGAYFWLHRFDCFKLLGWPPDPSEGLPGLVILAVVVGLNIGKLSSMFVNLVDRASHLAGCLFGVASVDLAVWLSGRAGGGSSMPRPAFTGLDVGAQAKLPGTTIAAGGHPAQPTESKKKILNIVTGQLVNQGRDKSP